MNDFAREILESLMILIFECIGTAMLACLYMSNTWWEGCENGLCGAYWDYVDAYGNIDFYDWADGLDGRRLGAVADHVDTNTGSYNTGDGGYISFFLGFFILLIFSARISGSHYNPIVTLAFMFRKQEGRFSRWLGLAYILFQFGGAWLGALFAYYCFGAKAYIGICSKKLIGQVMILETLGACVLVFLYLSQTEEKTKLSSDPAITTAIISASYLLALMIGYSYEVVCKFSLSPLNPAIALGQMSMQTFDGDMTDTHWQFVYLVFPWAGALLAVLLYECIFKKANLAVQREEHDEEAHEDHLND